MKHHLTPPELKLTAILFGLTIFLYGCSSSYTVSSAGKPTFDYGYREMNQELNGWHVAIEMKDGREISAREVKISEDSLLLVDAYSDSTFSIMTDEVSTVSHTSSLVGAAEGFGFGFIPGAAFGFVVGSTPDAQRFAGSTIAPALAGVFGSATGVIGGLVGLIVGHTYKYHFMNSSDNSKRGITDSLQNRK